MPLRPLESQDATHLNFTDMKVTRVDANNIKMALTVHGPGGAANTREVELHRVARIVKVPTKE